MQTSTLASYRETLRCTLLLGTVTFQLSNYFFVVGQISLFGMLQEILPLKNVIGLLQLQLKKPKNDKLKRFLQLSLNKKALEAEFVQPVQHEGKIIAFRVVKNITSAVRQKVKSWVPAWHGARFDCLDSIFQFGLKFPGTRLPNGQNVSVPHTARQPTWLL